MQSRDPMSLSYTHASLHPALMSSYFDIIDLGLRLFFSTYEYISKHQILSLGIFYNFGEEAIN